MFERELKLYELMRQLCHRLAGDVEDAQLTHQPTPGTKPPLWILGHLAISSDYAARLLGGAFECPKIWHDHFGRGSDNLPPADVRPPKSDLLAALDAGHRRVSATAPGADPAALEVPHRIALFEDSPLQTRGDLVGHLLTTHPAFHLGQLSTWRRQMGFAPLF